jgi:hypothetical protein
VSGPDGATPRTSAGVRRVSADAAQWAQWLTDRLYELTGLYKVITGVDTGSDVITIEAHGYSANDPVRLAAGVNGTMPAGLTAETVYYVKSPAADDFKLSATPGGAALDITTAGAGEVYVIKVLSPSLYLPFNGDIPAGKLSAVLAAILAKCGQVVTGATNTWLSNNIFAGSTLITGPMGISGDTIQGGKVTRSGVAARTVNRPAVILTDSNHTIDTTMGDTFYCAAPAAQRTITLRMTTAPVPFEGERIRIVRPVGGAFAIVIEKEGGAAAMVSLAASKHTSAEFEMADPDGIGAVWHLVANAPDSTPGADA